MKLLGNSTIAGFKKTKSRLDIMLQLKSQSIKMKEKSYIRLT